MSTLGAALVSPKARRQRREMSQLAQAFMEQAERAGVKATYDRPTGLLTMGEEDFVLSDPRDLKAAHAYSVELEKGITAPAMGEGRRGAAVGETVSPDVFAPVKEAARTAPPSERAAAIQKMLREKDAGITAREPLTGAVDVGQGVQTDAPDQVSVVEEQAGPTEGSAFLDKIASGLVEKLRRKQPLSPQEWALLKRKYGEAAGAVR